MRNNRQKQQGLQKPLCQHFHVKGNYVTQHITIQSGCHVYFTPDGGMQEMREEAKLPATPSQEAPLPRIELAFQAGIRAVLNAGLIQYKQDFRAIHQMLKEMNIYDRISYSNFIGRLRDCRIVPDDFMPSENNLKRLVFGSTRYPDWNVTGVNADYQSKLIKIASVFEKEFLNFLKPFSVNR